MQNRFNHQKRKVKNKCINMKILANLVEQNTVSFNRNKVEHALSRFLESKDCDRYIQYNLSKVSHSQSG